MDHDGQEKQHTEWIWRHDGASALTGGRYRTVGSYQEFVGTLITYYY